MSKENKYVKKVKKYECKKREEKKRKTSDFEFEFSCIFVNN